MSFFGRLLRKQPTTELSDPVFGPITFEDGIWSFIPQSTADGFMVTIAGPRTGPTDVQREFFQRIQATLDDLRKRARDFLQSRVDDSVDVVGLLVYSVEIGTPEESQRQEFVLELSDAAAHVIHRVFFRNGVAVDCGFDD